MTVVRRLGLLFLKLSNIVSEIITLTHKTSRLFQSICLKAKMRSRILICGMNAFRFFLELSFSQRHLGQMSWAQAEIERVFSNTVDIVVCSFS